MERYCEKNDIIRAFNGEKHIWSELIPSTGHFKLHFSDNKPEYELEIKNSWSILAADRAIPIEGRKVNNRKVYSLPQPGINWTEESVGERQFFEYSIEMSGEKPYSFSFIVKVTNKGTKTVSLKLTQEIAGLPINSTLFAPSGKDFYKPAKEYIALSYRDNGESLCMPLVTLFDEEKDVGFSLSGHIEMPVPPFCVRTDFGMSVMFLDRTVLDLKPEETATVRNYFIYHEGCWRPGLAWVRDKFSRFFLLPDEKLLDTGGCFVYSNVGDKELCRHFANEGVKNLEIHMNFVNLGKYVPDKENWVPNADDKWSAIKLTTDPSAPAEDAPYEEIMSYLETVTKPVGTTDRIKKFIRNLKSAGIRSFLYFQPTESWEFYADDYFPEDILRHEDGSPQLTWYDHVQMDCRSGSRWSEYLCQQLEQLLDMYPQLDGIFMDQAAGDRNDYSVSVITDRMARIVERRGKSCYWNGPYIVELAEHAVGMLAEGGSIQAEKIKYLTIGNKVCCGMGDTESQYQRNLINGLWPSTPSMEIAGSTPYTDEIVSFRPLNEERQKLHDRYMPLYELYAGKKWVLEPHPVEIPEGIQWNIFERPNGDYIIPLIVPGQSYNDGPYKDNVEVKIRASGTGRVKDVYIRTPDVEGQYAVPWENNGDVMTVTIPWIGSACLIWLSGEVQRSNGVLARPRKKETTARKSDKQVMIAYIQFEGVFPEGSKHGIIGGLKTTAPLPPIPERKVWFNGHAASIHTRNYRSWHNLLTILLPNDIMDYIKEENELLIEQDNPEDFFKLRNLSATIMLSGGKVLQAKIVKETYSSCNHSLAEGTIGSPVRIKIRFPGIKSE